MGAGLPYYRFNPEDTLAKNIGIGVLAAIGVARKDIQRLFGVSRSTVKRIQSIWRSSGAEGLKDYHQGAPGLDGGMKEFVIELYKGLEGRRGYQGMILEAVKEKYEKGEFSRTISRQTLYGIIKGYRLERERMREENEQRDREKERAGKDRGKKAEEQREAEERRKGEQPELAGGHGEVEATVVDCGGAVMTAVFVNEFQTMGSIPEGGREQEGEERFSNREMAPIV